MTYKIEVLPAAREDMLDHYLFIGRDSPIAADRFIEAAEATFESLAEMPRRGRRWESTRADLTEVRVHAVRGFRNYLIFYRPITDGVAVLHVFHGAQDIAGRLESRDD